MRLIANGSARTSSGPTASMVIGWSGWASRAAACLGGQDGAIHQRSAARRGWLGSKLAAVRI